MRKAEGRSEKETGYVGYLRRLGGGGGGGGGGGAGGGGAVARGGVMIMSDTMKDYSNLIKEMKWAAIELDALPDDVEFTLSDTDTLEEIRHHALRLAREVEAIFEESGGK
jgi:hypothetical protein